MKKVFVDYKYESGIPPNSIVYESENHSFHSKKEPHYEIVSYGPFSDFEWNIKPPLSPENKVFAIFNYNLVRWENNLTKEEFLLRIQELYAGDLEFFLFHPEALDAKLPEQYHKV